MSRHTARYRRLVNRPQLCLGATFVVERLGRTTHQSVNLGRGLLEDIASDINTADGCLSVMALDDGVCTTAFTPFGVENLKELLAELKPKQTAK